MRLALCRQSHLKGSKRSGVLGVIFMRLAWLTIMAICAAARVHERTELIALDAAEAYIDVVRYTRLIALSQENVAAHRKIFSNVQSRYSGGRAGEGDLQQAQERVAAAEAALAEFRLALD